MRHARHAVKPGSTHYASMGWPLVVTVTHFYFVIRAYIRMGYVMSTHEQRIILTVTRAQLMYESQVVLVRRAHSGNFLS